MENKLLSIFCIRVSAQGLPEYTFAVTIQENFCWIIIIICILCNIYKWLIVVLHIISYHGHSHIHSCVSFWNTGQVSS